MKRLLINILAVVMLAGSCATSFPALTDDQKNNAIKTATGFAKGLAALTLVGAGIYGSFLAFNNCDKAKTFEALSYLLPGVWGIIKAAGVPGCTILGVIAAAKVVIS